MCLSESLPGTGSYLSQVAHCFRKCRSGFALERSEGLALERSEGLALERSEGTRGSLKRRKLLHEPPGKSGEFMAWFKDTD